MHALIGEARQHRAVTRALLTQALLLGLVLAALSLLCTALLIGQRGAHAAQLDARGTKHTLLAIDAGGNRSVGRDAPPIGIRAGVDTAAIGWGLGLSRHGDCPDGSYHIQTQFCMQGLLHLRVYSLSSTP